MGVLLEAIPQDGNHRAPMADRSVWAHFSSGKSMLSRNSCVIDGLSSVPVRT